MVTKAEQRGAPPKLVRRARAQSTFRPQSRALAMCFGNTCAFACTTLNQAGKEPERTRQR